MSRILSKKYLGIIIPQLDMWIQYTDHYFLDSVMCQTLLPSPLLRACIFRFKQSFYIRYINIQLTVKNGLNRKIRTHTIGYVKISNVFYLSFISAFMAACGASTMI